MSTKVPSTVVPASNLCWAQRPEPSSFTLEVSVPSLPLMLKKRRPLTPPVDAWIPMLLLQKSKLPDAQAIQIEGRSAQQFHAPLDRFLIRTVLLLRMINRESKLIGNPRQPDSINSFRKLAGCRIDDVDLKGAQVAAVFLFAYTPHRKSISQDQSWTTFPPSSPPPTKAPAPSAATPSGSILHFERERASATQIPAFLNPTHAVVSDDQTTVGSEHS